MRLESASNCVQKISGSYREPGRREAYAKDGQKQQAIENYRKAVELDPKNQDAVDKLKELKKK